MMPIPVPDPYPIRPEIFFWYPIHTRPEFEKPYPSAPAYKYLKDSGVPYVPEVCQGT